MSADVGSPVEMERHLEQLHDRDPLMLDDGTVDRILRGMSPDDAPRAYRRVVALLTGLTAAPTAVELEGEHLAVTTIARRLEAAASSRSEQHSKARVGRRIRVAGAALVGAATLFAGLGAAGALPGAAQSVASNMLGSLGISARSPDSHAGTHPDGRGQSGTSGAGGATSTPGAGAGAASSGKGTTISGLAHDDSTTGVDKGAAVSSAASNDTSQAGDHGAAGTVPAATPPTDVGNAPVTTPNAGGTPAGDTASGGTSETGTDRAGDASGGRSADGSANAGHVLTNKP